MPYRTEVLPEVRRSIRTIPGNYRQRIIRIIDELASNPRPSRSAELRGQPGRYRIRLDRWRIIYDVDDAAQIVTVRRVTLKNGPETYEGLD